MVSEINTTGDQVNILIDKPGLPTQAEDASAFLTDLEAAVKQVLSDHDVDPGPVKIIDGHTYAMIDPKCPACRNRLKLVEPRLDSENGATARASCDCGWNGRATYRLIDVEDPHVTDAEDDTHNQDEDKTSWFEDTGSVRNHDVRPQYVPY